jgi:hypothetical protein
MAPRMTFGQWLNNLSLDLRAALNEDEQLLSYENYMKRGGGESTDEQQLSDTTRAQQRVMDNTNPFLKHGREHG